MNNQGKITVFLSLIMISLVMLGVTALQVADYYGLRAKSAMCAKSALSSVKSEYNSYIFEQYHILLFDRRCKGQGEAYMEEKIIDYMEKNLGPSVKDCEVVVTDYVGLADNNCEQLKAQIADYMKYSAVDYGVDYIMEKTDGADGKMTDELFHELDAVNEEGEESSDSEGTAAEDEEASSKDPRNVSRNLGGSLLLSVVAPHNMKLSDEKLSERDGVSRQFTGIGSILSDLDNEFEDFSSMKTKLRDYGSWSDSLIDVGTGIAYTESVFNCATDSTKNENSVLKCEMEYLICGSSSDGANLKGVVNKIIAIRMPVNYSYLMKDAEKLRRVESIAFRVSLLTPVPKSVLKYLMVGAWSYVESVAEVRNLLHGKKLPFIKDKKSWITDIDNLNNSMYSDVDNASDGMSYKDYLYILLALNMDEAYYRMLDIMQLNARVEDEDFSILDMAVELSVDISVNCNGDIFSFSETAGY